MDEPKLLREARDGQPGARERLLESFRNYLRALARAWIHRSLRAKVDESDVVQETLANAHERFGQFGGGSERELAAWLRKALARNLLNVARHFRAQARDVDREASLETLLKESSAALGALVPVAAGTSPSAGARRREAGVLLADALAKLSDDHRDVITLRSLNEMDWEDVAWEMGRSVEAVRKLWVRALASLKPIVEGAPWAREEP